MRGHSKRSVLVQPAIAAALAAEAFIAAPAHAALSSASGFVASSLPASPASGVITVTDFNVSGIFSNDGLGAPINEVFNVVLAPNASVIGIGWDVELYADPPSWLSEMVVAFGTSSAPDLVFLRPGDGDNFPGTGFYSSGGIVDLVDLGLNFDVDADGILRLEFFESFVDYPGDWDGIWRSGLLSIQWSVPGGGGGVIPEPGTWAMMIAGFGLVGFMARRRRATAIA